MTQPSFSHDVVANMELYYDTKKGDTVVTASLGDSTFTAFDAS